jgi:hypothetical protein
METEQPSHQGFFYARHLPRMHGSCHNAGIFQPIKLTDWPMSQHQHATELAAMGVKAAPALVVVAADATARTFLGVGLQEWVYLLTLAYLVFQIVVILPRVRRSFDEWFDK